MLEGGFRKMHVIVIFKFARLYFEGRSWIQMVIDQENGASRENEVLCHLEEFNGG